MLCDVMLCELIHSANNLRDARIGVVLGGKNVFMACLKSVEMDLLCRLSCEELNGSDTK